MTTAAERLVFLAGVGGAAGSLLVSLASGSTASDLMVARSGIGSNTAADHLMYDTGLSPGAVPHRAGFMSNLGSFMNRV